MVKQLVLPGYRKCTKCGIVKPLVELGKNYKRNGKQCYRFRCIVCRAQQSRKWREANPEAVKEYARKWRTANKKSVPEYQSKYQSKYRDANREKIAWLHREWRKNNPEKTREHARRYRARKCNSEGSFTEMQFKALCDFYGNICLCCGKLKKLERDHVISLANSGSSDIVNIQPLCKSCNASKGIKNTDYRKKLPEWKSLVD